VQEHSRFTLFYKNNFITRGLFLIKI